MAKSDKIGYVASCPLYGVMANVNAFAMGARAVNPDVKVYVEWSGIKDNDIEARFAEQGINCISDIKKVRSLCNGLRYGKASGNACMALGCVLREAYTEHIKWFVEEGRRRR